MCKTFIAYDIYWQPPAVQPPEFIIVLPDMTGRNQPCPCGSGKKYKKCCQGNNPRNTNINFKFKNPVRVDNIRIDPITKEVNPYSGNIRLFPESVTSEQSYARGDGKKNKVISKVFGLKNTSFSQPVKNLEQFDCVYAVDTNYKMVNGTKVCVAGITRGEKFTIHIPDKIAMKVSLKYGFVFSTNYSNPERIAWGFVADQARYWENLAEKRVGLIVDSDLECLEDISAGSEPLFLNIYLPKNYKIMYASADAEGGNPMNKMVKISDYGASLVLDELLAQLGAHDVSKVPIQPSLHSIAQNGSEFTLTNMPIQQEIGASHV